VSNKCHLGQEKGEPVTMADYVKPGGIVFVRIADNKLTVG